MMLIHTEISQQSFRKDKKRGKKIKIKNLPAGFASGRASDCRQYGRSEGPLLSAMIHQRFRGFKCLQDAVSVSGKRQGRGQRGRSPAEDAKTHISTFPPRLGGTKEERLIFIQRESRRD